MLSLDELAQEKDIEEVSLWLAEVLYAFLQSEIDLVNRRWVFYSWAYGIYIHFANKRKSPSDGLFWIYLLDLV